MIDRLAGALELGDELFWEPVRLALPGPWAGHLPFAFCGDPARRTVVMPDPGYPTYEVGARFAGLEPVKVPLTEANRFLIEALINSLVIAVMASAIASNAGMPRCSTTSSRASASTDPPPRPGTSCVPTC